MTDRSRLRWATFCIVGGGLLSLGWMVGSLVALFEWASDGAAPWRALRLLGPLGLCLVILGGSLCVWNLPALRKRVAEADSAE